MHAGAVGPQIGVSGLAAAGVELAHRGFVGVQAGLLLLQFGEPVGQRLQRHADAAGPLGQRQAGQRHALAGGDLFDPVQRQMVEVFAGRDPRQQADGGHAAIDDGRRDQRRRHCLAQPLASPAPATALGPAPLVHVSAFEPSNQPAALEYRV